MPDTSMDSSALWKDIAVTHSPSGQPPRSANLSQRGQQLTTLSAICGSIASGMAALWLLAMAIVARAVRPPELDAIPAYRGDVGSFQQAALTRVTAIVIVSFLAIMALAGLTILLGRRARRQSG